MQFRPYGDQGIPFFHLFVVFPENVVIRGRFSILWKLLGHRPGLPGKVITFHIVPLEPTCRAGLAGHVPVKEQPVKGVVDFEDRKMFEVFPHALDGEDLFDKGLSAYGVSSMVIFPL